MCLIIDVVVRRVQVAGATGCMQFASTTAATPYPRPPSVKTIPILTYHTIKPILEWNPSDYLRGRRTTLGVWNHVESWLKERVVKLSAPC